MIGVPAPTNALYGYGVGPSKRISTVRSLMASTDVIPANALLFVQPVSACVQ